VTNRIDLRAPRDGERYRALVATHGSPLLVLDCAVLRGAYTELSAALPGVRLYYAVKSLPAPPVVSTLASLGAGFDLASAGEVSLVQSLGVSPRRTIHTHPIKTDREIRAALRYGCTTFVVDNAYELQKLVRYRRRVGLLLRVSFRSPSALVDLSRKFGCALDGAEELLALAHNLGLHVKGLSFHVGSQSTDSASHVQAARAKPTESDATDATRASPVIQPTSKPIKRPKAVRA
jgi:ornithine decarboxylase